MSVPPSPAPSPPCPNCGLPWPAEARVCPNCGYVRSAIPSWPPPPGGRPGLSAPSEMVTGKLVTGKVAGDIFLGLGIGLALFCVGIGVVVVPILYYVLRRSRPVLARGLGLGWLTGIALLMLLLLGAFAFCLFDITQIPKNGG